MNKFLAGAIYTAFSTLERGVVGWFTLDMEPDEFWVYVFDWNQIGLDFVVGVGLDFLIDGIVDHFRPEVTASGFKGEFADAVGDSVNRELRDSMGDAMEESMERAVRETAEEAAERGARDATGEMAGRLDDLVEGG